jgi:hypothetical protein
MSARGYLAVSLLGLSLAMAVAYFQSTPGYMDASYYMAGGVWLADGEGFNERILWNYLDDPAGLPHPSHGYWMPLSSLLAALGMLLSGGRAFAAARLGFLALAAVIPILTARLSYALTGRRDLALLAGILAATGGFYLSYLPTTDAFGMYMLFGGLFFLALECFSHVPHTQPDATARVGSGGRYLLPLLLGGLAGLMHLTRADGILWLPVAMLFAYRQAPSAPWDHSRMIGWARAGLLALGGYLLVMGSWMWRNWAVFGALLSPGGSRALWITSYDELFIYPASLLTPARWWESGLAAILGARAWAAGLNLQTLLAVQGEIFLLPLMLAGLWRLRMRPVVWAGTLAWGLTFLLMSVIFPYQGARGGFFHSGAAIQPLLWAAAPLGLQAFLEWGSRRRGWEARQAGRFFKAGVVVIALLLTLFVAYNRVIGEDWGQPAWDERQRQYAQVEQALQARRAMPDSIIMVNDAPTYHLASRRPALSIPYGDLATLTAVAQRYQARYLLLEIEQVQGETLYSQPGDRPGLRYLETVEGMRLYEFAFP